MKNDQFLKTKDSNYLRDKESKVVVSTDAAYNEYLKIKNIKKTERQLQEEINTLQSKINRLEELLLKVLEKND